LFRCDAEHHDGNGYYPAACAVSGAVFVGTFLGDLFFAVAVFFPAAAFALAALAARAFLRFATSRAFACADSLLFGFAGVAAVGADSPRTFAQRRACAALIRSIASDENLLFFDDPELLSAPTSERLLPDESIAFSSSICSPNFRRFSSRPSIAAWRISSFSFGAIITGLTSPIIGAYPH